MTISRQELELIKKEVAGVRDYYNARMGDEIPPLKEEVDRIASQVARIQDMWRDGEKRAILSNYSAQDRPRVSYGKYAGMDLLDLAYIRSLLNASIRQPLGLNPRMLEEWQASIDKQKHTVYLMLIQGPSPPAFLVSGEYQRAIQDYDEAIRINPQDKYAYVRLALSYTFLGLDGWAQQYVDRAAELGVDRAELEEKLRHARTLR